MLRLDVAFAEVDAVEQSFQVFWCRRASDEREIRFLDAEAGMHQPMREIAVVGEEQQTFAVLVESADRVNTLGDLRHEIERQRSARGIVVCAQDAARLVDEPIDELLGAYGLAVD